MRDNRSYANPAYAAVSFEQLLGSLFFVSVAFLRWVELRDRQLEVVEALVEFDRLTWREVVAPCFGKGACVAVWALYSYGRTG